MWAGLGGVQMRPPAERPLTAPLPLSLLLLFLFCGVRHESVRRRSARFPPWLQREEVLIGGEQSLKSHKRLLQPPGAAETPQKKKKRELKAASASVCSPPEERAREGGQTSARRGSLWTPELLRPGPRTLRPHPAEGQTHGARNCDTPKVAGSNPELSAGGHAELFSECKLDPPRLTPPPPSSAATHVFMSAVQGSTAPDNRFQGRRHGDYNHDVITISAI
ncbi:Hypothetical predicted protein [Xyrichtys novacula]|uniref:Uncharacterized protein n=1 Tax=Xyrichtys novacula TaxID=13765 RepID=A0AAV1HPG0_XYRNO|nr:Hypothetical predicted protein [Xyrichtys novacula]